MLQRAASNAYSWWWASHIRTKQSKWLEQSLQDMEEKVQNVLKLIEEDGDSFAKRAEMYYKKRPELINFVEESYRAYRALSERYDHLSTELQNANNTIASVFPDQVQLEMDEEDEHSSRIPKRYPQVPIANGMAVPKVPKAPIRDWKGLITASKKMQAKKKFSEEGNITVPKSGLSKPEATEVIDKLQKDILALQTVKEFVKSSYESSLSRYWGIENQIMEMQEKICSLQDEFGVGKVIEDDEARTLMAEAALKSCQETLAQLQEKQERFCQEAKEEYKKIGDARQKLKSIRREFLHDQTDDEDTANEKDEPVRAGKPQSSNKEVDHVINERKDAEVMQEKTKEIFEVGPPTSLTVTELAEKIDELVNKVISLETSVSSQNVLINRLRTEADDLHVQIKTLEEDKANLIDDTQNLTSRVKNMEEKLNGIQDLNQNVENQNSDLQTHFAEACSSLDLLSEKLSNVKPDEEPEVTSSLADEDRLRSEELEKGDKSGNSHGKEETNALRREYVKDIKQDSGASISGPGAEGKKAAKKTVQFRDPVTKEILDEQKSTPTGDSLLKPESQAATETEGEFGWQHMLLSGLEDKEKILLTEYTTILRNYKEAKKKMSEMEKKDGDREFEVTVQIRKLKSAIAKRDEEIHRLRQKLTALQGKSGEDKDVKEDNGPSSDDRSVKPETGAEDINIPEMEEDEDDIKLMLINQPCNISEVEEKLRLEIDAILDKNLDFWLRFSTTYHQVQKFKTTVQDLEDEISKLQEKKKQDGSITAELKSDVRPIYKHLREIQTELTVWLEQSVVLKDEMQRRFSSLCNIQEKITVALKEGVEEEEILFSSHQAAKFQGEILNMKQENNKVRGELEAGVDHVTSMRLEIDKTLRKLNEDFELSGDHSPLRHSTSRSRVPLRSFIFGTKQRKHKHSLFSVIHSSRLIGNTRS